MAWRAIQNTVGQSESLAELSHLAERLLWRMLAHSDPWGRLEGKPRKLRALCYPLLTVSSDEVGYAMLELEQVGRVVFYAKADGVFIQILDFEENQPREAFRKRPPKSRIPDPPKQLEPTSGLVIATFRLEMSIAQERLSFPGLSGAIPESFRKASGGGPDETETETETETREDLDQELLAGRQAVSQYAAHAPTDEPGLPAGTSEEEDPEPVITEPDVRLGAIGGSVQSELGALRQREATA